MKNKLTLCIAAIACGTLLTYIARPKPLPPDGIEEHTWLITWMTSSNTVLVAEHPISGKAVKQFIWLTEFPRRNWGHKNIRYHWFGKPTFDVVTDEEGNRCVGVMVE